MKNRVMKYDAIAILLLRIQGYNRGPWHFDVWLIQRNGIGKRHGESYNFEKPNEALLGIPHMGGIHCAMTIAFCWE